MKCAAAGSGDIGLDFIKWDVEIVFILYEEIAQIQLSISQRSGVPGL